MQNLSIYFDCWHLILACNKDCQFDRLKYQTLKFGNFSAVISMVWLPWKCDCFSIFAFQIAIITWWVIFLSSWLHVIFVYRLCKSTCLHLTELLDGSCVRGRVIVHLSITYREIANPARDHIQWFEICNRQKGSSFWFNSCLYMKNMTRFLPYLMHLCKQNINKILILCYCTSTVLLTENANS